MTASAPTSIAPLPRVLVLASQRATAEAVGSELIGATSEVHTALGVSRATELLLDNDYDAIVLYLDTDDPALRRFERRLMRLRAKPVTLVVGGDGRGANGSIGDSAFVRLPAVGGRLRAELGRALGPRVARGHAETPLVMVGPSVVAEVLRRQVAALGALPTVPVLLVGESGSGTSDVAVALHQASDASGAMVRVRSRDLDVAELESHVAELLGTAGAGRAGTLCIDNAADLDEACQRVLRRHFQRVGLDASSISGRLVLTAEPSWLIDPDGWLGRGSRQTVFAVHVPALRERLGDFMDLVETVLSRATGGMSWALEPGAIDQLERLPWPRNLELLESVVLWARSQAVDRPIGAQDLVVAWERMTGEVAPMTLHGTRPTSPLTLRQIEHEAITAAFKEAHGNVTLAAKRLGIPRSTLRDRLRRLGVR